MENIRQTGRNRTVGVRIVKEKKEKREKGSTAKYQDKTGLMIRKFNKTIPAMTVESMSYYGFRENMAGFLGLTVSEWEELCLNEPRFLKATISWEAKRNSLFFAWIHTLPAPLAIFYLKNAYQWTDRQDLNIKDVDTRTVIEELFKDEPEGFNPTRPHIIKEVIK